MSKIGVLLSRFPKPSETFIERELEALSASGLDLEILPLRRKPARSMLGGPGALEQRVHRISVVHPRVLSAHLRFLRDRPRAYVSLWAELARSYRTRPREVFNLGGRLLKSVHFARHCLDWDITHVHAEWATHAATAAYVIHRLTGKPFSFAAHAHDIYVHQAFLKEKLERASFVVTCTAANAEFLRRLSPGARVHVVHHGLALSRYPARDSYCPGVRAFVAARLVPKKGLSVLVEACGRLHHRGLPVECRIAGDGPLRGELEALAAQLGVRDRVRFTGLLDHDAVITNMRWASVVVLPSTMQPTGDRDGIPNVLVEAMALGVPVVSTRTSSIPELVTDGVDGRLVPASDPDALAEAMQAIGADPELQRRMGRAGRSKIAREFDLTRTAAELAGLLGGPPPVGSGAVS